MSASITVGIIGTLLALAEIWKPSVGLEIERTLDKTIDGVLGYRQAMVAVVKESSQVFEYLLDEVKKGPQPITAEQFKANLLASFERYKNHALSYTSLASYYLLLKPLKVLIRTLNVIGRGKAVGGIGITLNFVGLYLSWLA